MGSSNTAHQVLRSSVSLVQADVVGVDPIFGHRRRRRRIFGPNLEAVAQVVPGARAAAERQRTDGEQRRRGKPRAEGSIRRVLLHSAASSSGAPRDSTGRGGSALEAGTAGLSGKGRSLDRGRDEREVSVRCKRHRTQTPNNRRPLVVIGSTCDPPEELIPTDYPEPSARLATTGTTRVSDSKELGRDSHPRDRRKSAQAARVCQCRAIRTAGPRSDRAGWPSRPDRNRRRCPRRPRRRTPRQSPAATPESASA